MPPTPERQQMLREKYAAMGWDLDTLLAVGLKIRPDPLTGRPEFEDTAQYLMSNQQDPNVQRMMQLVVKNANKHKEEQKTVIPNTDYSKLPLQKDSVWLIKMHFGGLKTASGSRVHAEDPSGSSQDGVRQTFNLYCHIRMGPGSEESAFRMMEEYARLPNSKEVETFIRGAMVKPYPVYEPCLPNNLLISNNLKQHEAALRPFLDSLPEPFLWGITPPELEEIDNEVTDLDSMEKFSQYVKLANEKKDVGNQAFGVKDQAGAVEAYEEAIHYLQKALYKTDRLGDAMKKQAEGLQAICYANCSAARMLEGEERDAYKAVREAAAAIELDASYAKGYVRLSRACESLGYYDHAQNALARALRLPQLAYHEGLVDCLISLQTDGKGLPVDNEAFKEWEKRIFSEGTDSETAVRMRDVGGLWRTRCKEHRKKVNAR